ncbi:MAG TPA: diacylglycerol kinase family protein [Cyclobacteriaceae bacterium]|jgi:diacylglycerol kinase|nr:diacylglycerol kinase family protein [Cyclobacteriaceae bacterium]HLT81883.1 diacylglycerol kinase family protein [Cyclobacteriaceae bacterium]
MKRFIAGFAFAGKGIALAFRSQPNLKVQVAIAVVVTVLGLVLELTVVEWACLLLAMGLVLSLEIANTAIEKMVDLVTREHHPVAGQVKDLAAGAVLAASIIAGIVGLLILMPRVVAWWPA